MMIPATLSLAKFNVPSIAFFFGKVRSKSSLWGDSPAVITGESFLSGAERIISLPALKMTSFSITYNPNLSIS